MSYIVGFTHLSFCFENGRLAFAKDVIVEKTRGGINLKRKMPTRIEDSGIKASLQGSAGSVGNAETGSSPLGGLFTAVESLSREESDSQFLEPTAILDGEDISDVCLTRAMMARMPHINFKNPFLMQAPTSKEQAIYMAWGYGLKSMPSSQKGSAYSDKYAVRLWTEFASVQLNYPVVSTSTGYANKTTTETQQIATGNQVANIRVDAREFQSRFDEMKSLPLELRLAGNAKSTDGDNHVAWLTIAILRILALKQAQETNSRANIVMSDEIAKPWVVPLGSIAGGRTSVDAAAAIALSNAWFKEARTATRPGGVDEEVPSSMYEMILPSRAAGADEVVYLAYLSGMLDGAVKWFADGEDLGIQPMYASIRSQATATMKIPLSNASRPIKLEDVHKVKTDLEVGRAEAILNAYIRTYDLEKQVNVAKKLALLAILDTRSNKSAHLLIGLPKPNHVMEYDLWVPVKPLTNSPVGLISSSESAGLLMALGQMQATMRNDMLCMKIVDHLEKLGKPVMSSLSYNTLHDWLHELMPSGFSSWARAWLTTVVGSSPPEIRRLANDSVHHFFLGLNTAMLTGTVHVSAMLFYGEKPQSGALRTIWDDALRVRLARQKFVTGPQSKVLKFLYSGKANIFDTNPTDWMHYLAEFGKRRDTRKIDSSLGVRSTNTVVGDPRIIFLGFRPPIVSFEDRMAEAQDAEGTATHYEPTFDFNNMVAFTPARANLGKQPADGRHSADPTEHSGKPLVPNARVRSDSPTRQIGKDKVNPLGRFFSNIYQPAGVVQPPSIPSQQYTEPPRTKLFNQGGVGSMRALYTQPIRNSDHNGLTETINKLKDESASRLNEIPDQLKNPEYAKGSEIIEIEVESAFANIERHFKSLDMTYTYAPLKGTTYVELQRHAEIQEVKGDGRCGVRSLQTSAVVNGIQPDIRLSDMFGVEARIMGLRLSSVAPGTHMADDHSLASIAKEFNCSLGIFHYDGNIKRNTRGIRFYTHKDVPFGRALFVIMRKNHYDALKFDAAFMPLLQAEDASEIQSWIDESYTLRVTPRERRPEEPSDEESSEVESEGEKPSRAGPRLAEKKRGGARSQAKRERRRAARQAAAKEEAETQRVLAEAASLRGGDASEPSGSEITELDNSAHAYHPSNNGHLSQITALRQEFQQQKQLRSSSDIYGKEQAALESAAKRLLSSKSWKGTVTKVRVTDLETQLPYALSQAKSASRYKFWSYLEALPGTQGKVSRAAAELAVSAGVDWPYMVQDRPIGEHEVMFYIISAQRNAVELAYAPSSSPLANTSIVVGYTTYYTGRSHLSDEEDCIVMARSDGNFCLPYIMRNTPEDIINEIRDISNYSKVNRRPKLNHITTSFAPVHTRELWVQAVRTELAKKGATSRTLQRVECDAEYWGKALPSRGCEGTDPDDTAGNNIELLSCFASALGCIEDVGFFRTGAVDWLSRVIGWVPMDQKWFGTETILLLALHRNFRVWEIVDLPGGIEHRVTEHKLHDTQATLPIVMSQTAEVVHLHLLSLPGRAGSSMENLAQACLEHRNDGKYPEPSVPGPTLPTPQHPDDLKLKDHTQAYILGWVSAGVGAAMVAGTVALGYRKRHQISGMVRNVRDIWRGKSVQAASVRSLQIATDRTPLLSGQQTRYTLDEQPGPLNPDYATYQQRQFPKEHLSDAGSVRSLRTVPLGGETATTTSRWTTLAVLRRWWGTAGEKLET